MRRHLVTDAAHGSSPSYRASDSPGLARARRTPLAMSLGFVALPPGFFLFLVVVSATYLAFVEVVKRRLFARFLG